MDKLNVFRVKIQSGIPGIPYTIIRIYYLCHGEKCNITNTSQIHLPNWHNQKKYFKNWGKVGKTKNSSKKKTYKNTYNT